MINSSCIVMYTTSKETSCLCNHKSLGDITGLFDINIRSNRVVEYWGYSGDFTSYSIPSVEYSILAMGVSLFVLLVISSNLFWVFYKKRYPGKLTWKKFDFKKTTIDGDVLSTNVAEETDNITDQVLAKPQVETAQAVNAEINTPPANNLSLDDLFFKVIKSEIFNYRWSDIFWNDIFTKHTWFLHSKNRKRGATTDAILLGFSIINMLLSTTIIVYLLYADDGQCQAHLNEQECINGGGGLVFLLGRNCEWSSTFRYCTFSPEETFTMSIVYIIIGSCVLFNIFDVLIEKVVIPLDYINWSVLKSPNKEDKYMISDQDQVDPLPPINEPDLLPTVTADMKTTTTATTTSTLPSDIEHTPPRPNDKNKDKDKDKDKDKRKNSNTTLMDQTTQDFIQGNMIRKNSNSKIKARDFKYRHPLYEENKEDITNDEVYTVVSFIHINYIFLTMVFNYDS